MITGTVFMMKSPAENQFVRWRVKHSICGRICEEKRESMDYTGVEGNQAFIEEHERLILAMGQAPHVLWEVDIPDRSYRLYNMEKAVPDDGTAMENFPECFFDRGLIHPDSEAAFRGFAGDLLNGSMGGAGNFIMRNPSGSRYEWVSFSYRMIYDSAGMPLKAIGIQEKLPSVSGTMFSAFSRRPLPELVRYHLLSRISASLTEDSVENLWFDGGNYSQWARGLSYTDIITQREKKLFARGELRAFEEDFHRDSLLKLYSQGIRWFSKDPTFTLLWKKSPGHPIIKGLTGDFLCYALLRSISEKKRLKSSCFAYAK